MVGSEANIYLVAFTPTNSMKKEDKLRDWLNECQNLVEAVIY